MFFVEDDKIYLTRGDDAALTVTLKNADGSSHALVTGDTLTLTVRTSPADDDIAFTITGGTTTINIPHNATDELEIGEYSCDIQLLSGGNRSTVFPALEGRNRKSESNFRNFIIMPEVTRT